MASTKGLRILHLYADTPEEWNCAQWRCLSPSDAINAAHEAGKTPHSAKLYFLPTALNWRNPQIQSLLGMYDVFSFQRNVITPDVWAAMDYWRALGKCITIDIDDAYSSLPPSNPAHAYWIRNRGDMAINPVEGLEEGMRHADALTAPSRVLLADWKHVVSGYYIPNYTRRAWYEPVKTRPANAPDLRFGYRKLDESNIQFYGEARPETEKHIMLGWGGSISHVDSWIESGICEALDNIFTDNPNVYLKFCGHEARLNYIFDRWGDRVVRQDGVKPEHWPHVVGSFDIGLAPLDTRPLDPPWRETAPVAAYDERRSWLKGIEYLSAGVPWIGSKSATYNDLARWGTLVDNTPGAWQVALQSKIKHLAHAKAEAQDRRRWAMKRVTMEGNVDSYCETYGRIIADKMTRNKAARIPGVAYVGI